MSVVDRKSLLLQLQEQLADGNLSDDDKMLCSALHLAIVAVQHPQMFKKPVPIALRRAALRWYKTNSKAFRCSATTIDAQMRFAEGLGLPRTRSNSRKRNRSAETGPKWVAGRLGISEDTVANKMTARARKLPQVRSRK